MIQAFGFMAGSRAIYLIVAILAIVTLGYSAHLGGVLVYDYGAGTALMASAPVPSEGASPASEPSSAGPIPDSVGADSEWRPRPARLRRHRRRRASAGSMRDPGSDIATVGVGDHGDAFDELSKHATNS